jgi:hypothetical protein
MVQGRKLGIKNGRLYCRYNVRYFDMNIKIWNLYIASSYEHIQELLKINHNVDYSYNVIQNIALGRKKNILLEITKCVNVNPTLENPTL